MNVPEVLTIVLIAIVSLTLISASIEDLKTRTVRNIHWIVIGSAGIAVRIMMLAVNGNITDVLPIIVSVMIMYGILNKSNHSDFIRAIFVIIMIILIAISYSLANSEIEVYTALSIPAFSAVFLLMYYTGLLRGGADAKCMIALTVAFPTYPKFLTLPVFGTTNGLVSFVFSFPLAILFHALILTMLIVIPFLYVNIKNRNVGRLMFSGYVMSIEKAETSHVWPMHDIRNGKLIRTSATKETKDVYSRLKEHGETDVWVTPKIPFIFPITISFLFTAIIGNPLFLIL